MLYIAIECDGWLSNASSVVAVCSGQGRASLERIWGKARGKRELSLDMYSIADGTSLWRCRGDGEEP